ncbi:sec-independent protein translocase protein TATA, chloroplastic isoform X2 [Carya illinoinensis]|uniref:sec-independent protein translocase protein TATA, chloroplastic isoform X2 n=1 Tax=Carya illinoinensis TaxID=32201 RepID=UPI001C720D4D|nr:sec-independent protein translocase protein TATA, chloroplastic isoform X2 [Carya illinoinensis]
MKTRTHAAAPITGLESKHGISWSSFPNFPTLPSLSSIFPDRESSKTHNPETMEISSVTLCFSSTSRMPPPSLSFSSSNSTFLTSFATSTFLNKTKHKSNTLVASRTGTRTDPAKKGLTCNALFGLGVPELVVIAGVAALVFGPKKLPEVGKSIGKTVKSFQQGMNVIAAGMLEEWKWQQRSLSPSLKRNPIPQ